MRTIAEDVHKELDIGPTHKPDKDNMRDDTPLLTAYRREFRVNRTPCGVSHT